MTGNNSLCEKETVTLLKAGDRNAFEILYHAYKRRVYTNLRKLLHSDSLAEEYLQEVFYKLWARREQLDPEKAFPAYLFRIAANLVCDHFRKAATDQKIQAYFISSGSELYDHIESLLNYKESQEKLETAIALLPPKRQEIFRLCKVEGKSYEEVSLLLGISTSTINDHIVKGTRLIKDHFYGNQEIALLLLVSFMMHQK